jgi:hypothetical protein
MSRTAWLVVIVSIAAFAGVLAGAELRHLHTANTSRHVSATASRNDIGLTSELSIRQRIDDLDLVVTITVENKTDDPVMYVGAPCYPPAAVALRSTLQPPAGPPYGAAATALRAHVMDYRRSFDEIGYFEPNTYHLADYEPCSALAPPMLPPKKTVRYTMTTYLGTYASPFVDAATTDVVTTLELGALPRSTGGRFPPPIQVVDTVEVRTPLSTVSDMDRPSSADYESTARHFDLLMSDPRISKWVEAQDPTLWRDARLTPDYRHPGAWVLEAFNGAWALPLVVKGTDSALTEVQIPAEPRDQVPTTDAVLPPDSSSADTAQLPFQDMYVGDLVLPSGKVMVGDGFASDNEVLFDFGLKPGSYPIHIVTAKPLYRTADYVSVAWEELLLSSTAVTHWVPAVPVGHSLEELKPGELFIFGTDGGGGGFASPEAMKYIDAALPSDDDPLLTPVEERLEANDWLWSLATVDSTTGANVFVTTTGGDGGFPIILGLDAQNRPAVLLADFGSLQMTFSGMEL